MPVQQASIAGYLDQILPAVGSVGYIALIDGLTGTATISSINTSTDVVTTSAAHGLVTGTRIRMTSTGALPVAIASATDYYVREITTTTLTLHPTLSDAKGATGAIDFTDSGSGTITLLEQALSGGLPTDLIQDDPLVWLNHELSHPDYARIEVTGLGATNTLTGAKPIFPFAITVNSPNGTLSCRHAVFLDGGISTIGDTTYVGFWMSSAPATVTITEGSTKTFNFNFRMSNATA